MRQASFSRTVTVVLVCLLLAACPRTDSRRFHQDPADPSALAQTWLNAWVYVESQGAVVSSTVGTLRESGVLGSSELAAPALVLIFLHGCDGLWPLRHEADSPLGFTKLARLNSTMHSVG